MKHGYVFPLIILSAAVLCLPPSSRAQRLIIPITGRDSGGTRYTDTLGWHINATYCIDGWIDDDLWEYELPPKPPGGIFDFRFIDHRTTGACLGVGTRVHTQYWDVGGFLDTFRIAFQPGETGYPLRFSWSPQDGVGLAELRIRDLFGGFFVDVDMLTDSSVVVTNPAITMLDIVGLRVVEPPVSVDDARRFGYSLARNYPNPFNPTTTISYSIPLEGPVTLKIFDLAGIEISTLVSERKAAGAYSVDWSARGFPSGLYVYRMMAGPYTSTKKMLVIK